MVYFHSQTDWFDLVPDKLWPVQSESHSLEQSRTGWWLLCVAENTFIGIWHKAQAKFSIWNLGSPTVNSCHGALVWAEGTLIGYEPLIRLGGQAFVLLHVSLLEKE